MNKLLTWTAILFVASSAVLQGQDCIIKESSGKEKKVSKTWEAMMRLKGSLIMNDPKFLL